METKLLFGNDTGRLLDHLLDDMHPASVHVLVDENTDTAVWPIMKKESLWIQDIEPIIIPSGDDNKTLATAQIVWDALVAANATRHSVLVNVGGGMVTDLGGFVAATYRRGMLCINMPTTILGAVDAAVGGKTAVNYDGLKNLVGVFAMPYAVICSSRFFATLPESELKSGYAEMLKHALLKGDTDFARLLQLCPEELVREPDQMLAILEDSVKVKTDIVAQDPEENGVRKALNLGHTAGHAFEELAMKQGPPIPHGYAVAYGLVVACALSVMSIRLDSNVLYALARYVSDNYGAPNITCKDYPALIELMHHDKKNVSADAVLFTLLAAPGKFAIDCVMTDKEIGNAMDVMRDLLHI